MGMNRQQKLPQISKNSQKFPKIPKNIQRFTKTLKFRPCLRVSVGPLKAFSHRANLEPSEFKNRKLFTKELFPHKPRLKTSHRLETSNRLVNRRNILDQSFKNSTTTKHTQKPEHETIQNFFSLRNELTKTLDGTL